MKKLMICADNDDVKSVFDGFVEEGKKMYITRL